MKKVKKEDTFEVELNHKLNNFNPEEVESYLEVLLRKCLEATTKNDYLTLGNVENILNKSVVILGSKVKNFNIMYTNLKLKVATEELAKYIEVDNAEAFNFFNVLPDFVTLEEANLIAEVEDFQNYKYGKININFSYEHFNNKKYAVLFDKDSILILEKGTGNKIAFESWDGNLEVFKEFVTNSAPSEDSNLEVISLMNYENNSLKSERIEKIYPYIMAFFNDYPYFNFNEDNILYFKENPSYMAIVTNDYFIFIYDKKTGLFDTFSNHSWSIKDNLFSFLDYCLGVPTEEVKLPEAKVVEVYNVFIKFLLNSTFDLKQLINLYNKNPSDEHYKLIESCFFRNQDNFKLIFYLLEDPYITENIEPEVIKTVHNSFKDYSSVNAEVLEIAKTYNNNHLEENEKINAQLREQEELLDYFKQLSN